MKKILIISNYIHFEHEKGNSRFLYLINLLLNKQKEKFNCEVVTSTFYHREKKQRENTEKEFEKLPYKSTLLYEPGYKKNISLKRFYSHYILSKNLKKYLKNLEEKPDIIYCAVPPLGLAKQAAKYAKKNKIKFIIDIQDLWPEAFKMIFNIPIISNIIFYPLKKQTDYVYKQADDIVAVSETYANRAMTVNKNYKNKVVAFLGTDLLEFDKFKKEKNDDNTIKIVYIGTLGHSYNITIIIDAIAILNMQGIKNIKFIVMGDGPLKNKFEIHANQKNIDCEFLGRLEYNKMIEILSSCDIAVNPIAKGAAQSIINKVGDYAAAGLPVINTQECEEYRQLVEKFKIGYNCQNNNADDVADKIKKLIENKEKLNEFGKNNRKLAEEKFDRATTYKNIIDLFE